MNGRHALVIVRGGGDLGSGVTARLMRSGYLVVVLETEAPAVVRRTVAFAQAVFSGRVRVEDLTGLLVERRDAAAWVTTHEAADGKDATRTVPVVVDPEGTLLETLRADAVVDARMAKRNLGTRREDAAVTIAIGPGFEAGVDCDAVVETNRGHSLGRVLWSGTAERDTGVPAPVLGIAKDRLVRAPGAGVFESSASIGDLVEDGDVVGAVEGAPVLARTPGLLRGLVADGLAVREGQKIGDVDPRGQAVDPAAISDKALAVGGGVLEALLARGVQPVLLTARARGADADGTAPSR